MTRPQDKAKERLYAEDMIRLLQLGVVGAPVERERPDFCLALADGRLAGLEVVRAVDEGIAAGLGAKRKMKARVTAGLIAAGANAHVNFSISDGAAGVIAAHNMKVKLASEIDALVRLAVNALTATPSADSPWRRYQWFEDIVDDTGFVCWRDPDRDRGSEGLEGSGVEFCTAVMVRRHSEPLTTASGTSFGQPASIIQDSIDEKASLLPEYRKTGYDVQWLLVVGSATAGGTLDISDAEGEFTSPFDRTFFIERFEGKCVELRIRR